MPTEIREAGYQLIREYIDSSSAVPPQWDYLELRDANNDPVTRISVTADSRAQWIHTDSTEQVLIAEIVVTGADSDIPLSTFFEGSAMYTDVSGSGVPELSFDGFPQALIETEDDELTIEHRIEVPEVTT